MSAVKRLAVAFLRNDVNRLEAQLREKEHKAQETIEKHKNVDLPASFWLTMGGYIGLKREIYAKKELIRRIELETLETPGAK